jgi:hypothetical protein
LAAAAQLKWGRPSEVLETFASDRSGTIAPRWK